MKFAEDGLPPQGPTRKQKLWFVVPYMDCSGLEVCHSEQHARDVAILLANKVRGLVWIYEADAKTMAAPAEALIQAFVPDGEVNG
jgi:hypothetical protein